MIDHASVPVRNLEAGAAFYEALLRPLGLVRLVTRERTVGFGKRYPELWLNLRPDHKPCPDQGGHLCLRAPDANAVQAFHSSALVNGGTDAGEPGERRAAMTTYYAAFVVDPDGNKLEAACFPAVET